MYWYLNDLSLQGQFKNNQTEFLHILSDLAAKKCETFRISAEFSSRIVHNDLNVADLLKQLKSSTGIQENIPGNGNSKEIHRKINAWIDKHRIPESEDNPFIELELKIGDIDVNNSIFGTALNKFYGESGQSPSQDVDFTFFSFQGGTKDFSINPINLKHIGHSESVCLSVNNFCKVIDLFQDMKNYPELTIGNWVELVNVARDKFPNLIIGEGCVKKWRKQRIDRAIIKAVFKQLSILNDYAHNCKGGVESPIARKIFDDYFRGSNSLFSNEAKGEREGHGDKYKFKSENGDWKFAPYHGKIRIKKYECRIHFDYSESEVKEKLEILYIGPKINPK